MNDPQILGSIDKLVNEEHELLKAGEQHSGLDDTQRARLHELQVTLDQCWDLLRQRRARREFGQNPDDAKVRDATTVEHYQQ